MNVINIVQRTPEWKLWRADGVTASEAAIVLGRSPYMTRWHLWAEIKGLVAPDDLSRNPFVQRGIAFEDMARRSFEDRHRTILLPVCAQSDEHPVLRCSLDGLSDTDEPVELKVPADKTYQVVAAERELAVAYQLYWVQVQFQILVTDAARGWLVFDPCKRDMPAIEFSVARNETFLRMELIPACLAFWELIRNSQAPPQDRTRDPYLPVGNELKKWTAMAREYRKLATERHDLEDGLKSIKAKMADKEAVFVGLMGEFLLAESQGIRVTRFRQSGTERLRVSVKGEPAGAESIEPTHTAATAETCFYF